MGGAGASSARFSTSRAIVAALRKARQVRPVNELAPVTSMCVAMMDSVGSRQDVPPLAHLALTAIAITLEDLEAQRAPHRRLVPLTPRL
jgi:hypothetical protein